MGDFAADDKCRSVKRPTANEIDPRIIIVDPRLSGYDDSGAW
jgi:hypothetical protein